MKTITLLKNVFDFCTLSIKVLSIIRSLLETLLSSEQGFKSSGRTVHFKFSLLLSHFKLSIVLSRNGGILAKNGPAQLKFGPDRSGPVHLNL